MKALNLYTLTRMKECEAFSSLEQALSGRPWHKTFSAHETASLCRLVDRLAPHFHGISCFDGFYFSYTIEHISKEFDLLKFSEEGDCVLNIELKSESIEEDRIRKQLDQNRYYLTHVSRTILSYTYVMETDSLYCLNDHGFLGLCDMSELAEAMHRPALSRYVESDIQRFFRAQDYLISPVRNPEKLLTGRYFLTNQQADFRRRILDLLQEYQDSLSGPVPVISLTGNAGTGKTLLLFDLAIEVSRKRPVLFLHGGPLREGHRVIDRRLHKVTIRSGTETDGLSAEDLARRYACILVDEANRFSSDRLQALMERARRESIPCIFSYDPHSILGPIPPMEDAEAVIAAGETLRLELSGNIRINRPIFSFLRTLFHQKDRAGHVDYSCIDVLYAADKKEEQVLVSYYLGLGYERIASSPDTFRSGEIISQEYDKVLMILDRHFYYDESLHLCADIDKGAAIPPLYEGLSRAREKLCLIITGNPRLFRQVLDIRNGISPE